MIVFDWKYNRLTEIMPEAYNPQRYLRTDDMSANQREAVIGQYIHTSAELSRYIQSSTSNRVNLLTEATHLMVKGKIKFNLAVIMVLLADCHWEMRWRVH